MEKPPLDIDMTQFGFDPNSAEDVTSWHNIVNSQVPSTQPYDYQDDSFEFGNEDPGQK